MTTISASPLRRVALFPLLLLLAFCQGSPKKSTFKYVAPTAAEAEAFGKSLDLALANGNVQRMSRLINWEHLIEKTTTSVPTSPQFRASFAKGMKQGVEKNEFAQQLIGIVEKGGRIERLRIRTVDGQTRLVLRVLMPDSGGVNYHEMTLHRGENGFVQASDIYIYTSAEALSETFERMFKLAAAEQEPGKVLARMFSGEKSQAVTKDDFKRFRDMTDAATKGEHDRTIELYRKLPPQLRKDKMIMTLYVNASSNKGDEAYAKALGELQAAHPNERGLSLMLIDTYLLQKKYGEALEAIDRVDAAIGGDPYLETLRANVLISAGDFGKAKEAGRRAIEKEPMMEDGYWSLVTIALSQNDHAEVSRLLTTLRDEVGVELVDLTTLPDYARYVQTTEYAAFMRSGDEETSAE